MINQSIDHKGFRLRIRCICGGGTVTLTNGTFSVSGSAGSGMRSSRTRGNGFEQEVIAFAKPFLWVDQCTRPKNQRFIVRKKDGDEIHVHERDREEMAFHYLSRKVSRRSRLNLWRVVLNDLSFWSFRPHR